MAYIHRCFLLSTVLLVSSGCGLVKTTSARIERTTVTNYGLFQMGPAKTEAAPDTGSGVVHMGDSVQLVSTTDKVPRRKGTAFGYQFVLEGEPKGAVLPVFIVVDHPPIHPLGTTAPRTQESWKQNVTVGTASFAGWKFDEEAEMVAGTWTVRVFYGPRPLVQRSFTVE